MIFVFLLATVLSSLSPGPAVLLAIAVSLRSGIAAGVRAVIGICLGSMVYFLLALGGVLAFLAAHALGFQLLQLAGAAYLVWLGIGALRAVWRGQGSAEQVQPSDARPLRAGLATQLSNPKAILYWTALLPPFLNPGRPMYEQLALLVGIGIPIDFVVLSLYVLLAASARSWLATPRFQRLLGLAAGTLFTVLGSVLFLSTLSRLALRGK
ncbi:MAG: LysE family translocator [Polyangiaceae bacterium]